MVCSMSVVGGEMEECVVRYDWGMGWEGGGQLVYDIMSSRLMRKLGYCIGDHQIRGWI